jgi:sulfide:quinone oxidoreductase
MAHVVVMGAGIAGLPTAYELRTTLPREHEITLINASETFEFTPSNPWIAVGTRKRNQTTIPLGATVARRGIGFKGHAVVEIDAPGNRLKLANGEEMGYDYLVITTGPRLAFEAVPGLGPASGFTESVCTLSHAESAYARFQELLENPGPIVVGAVQGASCFGPAYEFAMILDHELRKRRLRHKAPMTFVTSEPYIGHLGLAGVGDSLGLLESALRERDIRWVTNASIAGIEKDKVYIEEHGREGEVTGKQEVPLSFGMLLPSFAGVDAVAAVSDMCNPKGFVKIDEHQRNPTYTNIFSAGVCVAIPPVEATPVPTGAPKTGYMIESMMSAITENIRADLAGEKAEATATWNAICLADMGNKGFAFVAMPQIAPRNVTWTKGGRWVHWAKVAYEKYFLRKMRAGKTEPFYERYMLRALGIKRLNG